MSALDRWTGGPQLDGTYAVGQSVTVKNNRLKPRSVLQSLPSGVAVAGVSNPHFG